MKALAPFLLAAALLSPFANAAKMIPAPPTYYVQDEPEALSPKTREALQALLIEHDHLTGEQFVIAIFKSLEGEDVVDFTNRVFSTWAIGQRGKDNGVLLALYVEDRKARIEVGYGLEATLTDAKSKDIIENFLLPEMKQNQPDRALSLATLEILKTLGSPLIANGKAEQIIRGGGFQGTLAPRVSNTQAPGGWLTWILLGAVIFTIVMNQITSAEAHFTGQGWYKPKPWQKGFRSGGGGPWFGGGGFGGGMGGGGGWSGDGGGLGGGGFSGGGGSSGGGGASGSW